MPYLPNKDAINAADGGAEQDLRRVPQHKGIVGILGGMGPIATTDFYMKLVQATPAEKDQDHLQALIWSDPTIPDRTQALLQHGEDPTPAMIAGARLLESAGASLLAVPCNTAHAFAPAVQSAVSIPIIDMIEETARCISCMKPAVRRVGLLATTGTVQANLYQEWLDKKGIEVLVLGDHAAQERVMASIRSIKAGDVGPTIRRHLQNAAESLVNAGAQAVIAGCTEIPLGLDSTDVGVPLVDPAEVLAAAVVEHINSSLPQALRPSE